MKPIVKYHEFPQNGDVGVRLRIGKGYVVCPIDHPSYLVSNNAPAFTSRVIKINDDGFETMNTIYKLVEE